MFTPISIQHTFQKNFKKTHTQNVEIPKHLLNVHYICKIAYTGFGGPVGTGVDGMPERGRATSLNTDMSIKHYVF